MDGFTWARGARGPLMGLWMIVALPLLLVAMIQAPLAAVAYETYDERAVFEDDRLFEEANPRDESLRLRVAYYLAPLDNSSYTDWDFAVVTDAMYYGRFAADDVMHLDMGVGLAYRYGTFEQNDVQTGVPNATANIDNFYHAVSARFAMGMGFALSESWRLDFIPYFGIGGAFAKYRVRRSGILPVNQVKDSGWAPVFEYGFSTGVWYKPSYKWDFGVDLLFDGAVSEHGFDSTAGEFDANYRQFNLAIAVGIGYWF